MVAPATVIFGVAFSIAALLIHEFLHAIVYPSKATVVIGFVPKQFAAVALASYPLKRNRFILMCLLPYLLGVIPIILFCISPATAIEINGFLFGLSIMGLTSPYVDSYNVYQVLKQTSKNAQIPTPTFYIKEHGQKMVTTAPQKAGYGAKTGRAAGLSTPALPPCFGRLLDL